MRKTSSSERSGAAKLERTLLVGAAVAVLAMGLAAPRAMAQDEGEIPFEEANLFFELNDTDGDLGIHALVDGEDWKRLQIEGADEKTLLDLRVRSRLRSQGLTELFFESSEPSFDELAPEVFFERFPEGTYEFEGVTLDGEELESEVELTHLLPAPPAGILVSGVPVDPASVDCDEAAPEVDAPVEVSWDPVSLSHPDLGRTNELIEVVGYQVVVEREEPELLVYSVDLPPDVTGVEVPDSFIALGDEFKLEVLVREASGNQTAVESCFELE